VVSGRRSRAPIKSMKEDDDDENEEDEKISEEVI
jgi:hypothetical protein